MTAGATAVRPAARRFLVAVGLCDLVTGLGLLIAPALVLGRLDPGLAAERSVFVRWLGVFVATVGAAYLYPWLARTARRGRIATSIEVTALQRGAVAIFVVAAVATAALGPLWLAVACFDGGVAAVQLDLLRRGWIGHA